MEFCCLDQKKQNKTKKKPQKTEKNKTKRSINGELGKTTKK
jgi:hypothetical protein